MKHMLLVIPFLLTGCFTSTELTGFKGPASKNAPFKYVAVYVATDDLVQRKEFEDVITEEFTDEKIKAIPFYRVYSPVLPDSAELVAYALEQEGVDALLVVTPGAAGWSREYVPPTVTSSTTKGTTTKHGNTVRYKEKTTYTTSGGYTLAKPWAKYSAELFDTRTDERIWVGSGQSQGNAFTSHSVLASSLAGCIVDDFLKENIVLQMPER